MTFYLIRTSIILIVIFTLISCFSNNNTTKKIENADTTQLVSVCDTFSVDKPPVKDYKKTLSAWLETTSLDWFLEKRQMAWREAKVWNINTFSIDSNSILKCLSQKQKNLFLYIPNHYYNKEKNGNEYFQFFIVNNSKDTILIPSLDDIINNISTSISYISQVDTSQHWLSFQETDKVVECGNSNWTMKLPPKRAIKSQIESDYLYLGDTTVNYRIELTFGKQKIVSNTIKINLMKKQLPYLGKSFN